MRAHRVISPDSGRRDVDVPVVSCRESTGDRSKISARPRRRLGRRVKVFNFVLLPESDDGERCRGCRHLLLRLCVALHLRASASNIVTRMPPRNKQSRSKEHDETRVPASLPLHTRARAHRRSTRAGVQVVNEFSWWMTGRGVEKERKEGELRLLGNTVKSTSTCSSTFLCQYALAALDYIFYTRYNYHSDTFVVDAPSSDMEGGAFTHATLLYMSYHHPREGMHAGRGMKESEARA